VGYRSEVRSIIKGNSAQIKVLLVSARMENNYALTMFKENLTIDLREKEGFIELHIEDIKWYSDTGYVRGWERILHQADELGLYWEIARVGEDVKDVEVESSAPRKPPVYSVSRTITRNSGE
jgi:hypothetical protein